MNQPSFFDIDPEAAPQCVTHEGEPLGQPQAPPFSQDQGTHPATPGAAGVVAEGRGPAYEWREVPQVLFLSWSEIRQLDYCARRDEDSAARTRDVELKAFYLERAARYKEDVQSYVR